MRPASPLPLELPSSLVDLAEVIHASAAPSAPVIAALEPGADGRPRLCGYVVPTGTPHPVDPLIGIVAPARWTAVGLVASGRIRSTEGSPPVSSEDERISITYVVDRSGAAASVYGPPDGPLTVTAEPPVGWVPDVLARVLELPTPPPEGTSAAWIDAIWLDRLAAGVFRHPGRRWTWRSLAERHPLFGSSATPTPARLADLVRIEAATKPWSVLRTTFSSAIDHQLAGRAGLGEPRPIGQWFDDGSFSRWLFRDLPPSHLVLTDLVDALPTDVGDCLVTGLAETTLDG